MKLNAKFKALLAFAAIAVGLTACGGGSGDPQSSQNSGAATVAAIKEKGVIRIGVFGDKPPFGYVDANGKNQGFDVEIAKDLAKDLLGSPDKVEFVLTEAANRVEYVPFRQSRPHPGQLHQNPRTRRSCRFCRPLHESGIGRGFPQRQTDYRRGATERPNPAGQQRHHR